MEKGKKNKTSNSKTNIEVSYTINAHTSSRNLWKGDLGAVIFGCKHHTFSECLTKKLFGLPAPHYSYVRNITPGLPLFLFNYSDRMLHGIFEAETPGQMGIDQFAWTDREGTDITSYPAQVRMVTQRMCRPLHEEEFKPLIVKNYYAERLFWFELDKAQAARLINLFLSSPLPEKKVLFKPTPEVRQNPAKEDAVAADSDSEFAEPKKIAGFSWADLLKPKKPERILCDDVIGRMKELNCAK